MAASGKKPGPDHGISEETLVASTVLTGGGRFVSSPSNVHRLITPSDPQAHGMEERFNGRIGRVLPPTTLAPQGAWRGLSPTL